MAKAAWLTVDPMSGSGNQTVTNTGTVHTGRTQRTTQVTGVAVGVSPNKTYTVVQKPKAEFVSFDDGSETSVAKTGGTLTITGKSNSASLTFSLLELEDDGETEGVVEGGLVLTLPDNYTAGGTSTANGAAITGDPGATQEYAFSIAFTGIPANTTINELTAALKVTALGGQEAQISIKQSAGDPTFSFSEETLSMEADGSAVSVQVISNTSWTLS